MATLTIERCDYRIRAEEIKGLFLRNDRPTFPRFFDRAYGPAMAAGGAGWIGLDAEGKAVMHVALFPVAFRHGTSSLRAGVLGDLMADVSYRNFWGPSQLLRRALADLRGAGNLDFVYSDPTPISLAVTRAAGLSPLGQLRRYVLPLQSLYLTAVRLRRGQLRLPLAVDRIKAFDDPRVTDALGALLPGPGFRADRSLEFYRRRIGGDVFGECTWRLVRSTGRGRETVALALMASGPSDRRLVVTDLLWDADRVSVSAALLALAGDARREGYRALDLTTLEDSSFAREALVAGFVGRQDTQPIVGCPLDPQSSLPAIGDWYLTAWDGSAW